MPKHSTTLPVTSKDLDPEERKALLHNAEDDVEDTSSFESTESHPRSSTRRRIAITAAAFIALLITGTLARTVLFSGFSPLKAPVYLLGLPSNGTEAFKRTVLIVSIDGLRYACSLPSIAQGHKLLWQS